MFKWIKKLIAKFKAWRKNRHYKHLLKLDVKQERTLFDYTLFQAHLSKKEIIKLIETDTDIPKKTIKAIVKLGSKKVRKFLLNNI